MNYCQNCGAKLDTNNNFCTECGNKIIKQNESNEMSFDEQLLNIYTKGESSKEGKRNFSWKTLLLGPYYLLYKNMILLGSLLYIFEFIIMTVISVWIQKITIYKEIENINNSTIVLVLLISIIIILIVRVILSIFYDKLYMKHSKNKIQKIKNVYSLRSKESIIEITKKESNNKISVIIAVLLIIFNLIIIPLCLMWIAIEILNIIREFITSLYF